jgi:hypothetical protein
MSKRKKALFAPKHCKGRKPGCRKRRKKHISFLKAEYTRLKNALADKSRVVRAGWIDHYATIIFSDETQDKIYCNYNCLCFLLRNRLFYKPAPYIIINQYFYNQMEHTSEGDFMVGHPNLKEKLVGKTEKEISERSAYLGSDLIFQDARKLRK